MSIPLSVILVISALIVSTQLISADSNVKVFLVTDENITAEINGSAGGNISYFIDGIEVKGEFENLWEALAEFSDVWSEINSVKKNLDGTKDVLTAAAETAYDNKKKLEEHDQVLLIHYNAINDTINELIAFEDDYAKFVNFTNTTLGEHDKLILIHASEIQDLKQKYQAQQDQIDQLKKDFDEKLMAMRNTLIGLFILGFGLYLINHKYPLVGIIKRRGRNISDAVSSKFGSHTRKVKSKKLHSSKLSRIRINPDRSPYKVIKNMVKNPHKSV
jgi:hypothetical protein